MRKLTWLTKMYVEFLLLSFFITDESFERPLVTPFRSMMMMKRELMTFVACVVFVPRIVLRRRSLSGEKKGKKVLHTCTRKSTFLLLSQLLFFDEKVFKETQTQKQL